MSPWSAEQEALRETTQRFVAREVTGHLDAWEDAGEVPRELHLRAAEAGLLGVGFPESVGGQGGGLGDAVALQEAFFEAGGSSGLAAALFTGGIALPHLAAQGTPEQVDRWVRPTLDGRLIGALAITEPGGGSDVARVTTTAVRDREGYVVNGAKAFITSGVRCDFVTTLVRTGGPGHAGLSLLVVEKGTPGFAVDATLDKLGWRCSDTALLSFTDARVPVSNLVGPENAGFALVAEQLVVERVALAVHGYGVAARALALAAAYARERATFGGPLVARQVVQHRLVEMHRRVDVARQYVRSVAARYDAGEPMVAEACLAKQTGVEAAAYVCDQAVQLFGGAGYLRGAEVERHYRDARLLGIGGGATEVLADLAARLLGYAGQPEPGSRLRRGASGDQP